MRLVLENFTVTGMTGGLKVAFCRSTNRYSTRAVQLSAKAASMPAPAVQPALVSLFQVVPLTFALMSPKAPPAVA